MDVGKLKFLTLKGKDEGSHIVFIAMLQLAVQSSPLPLFLTLGDSLIHQDT